MPQMSPDCAPKQHWLVFRDLIARSNSNGGQVICRGEFEVCIDRIPDSPPTDWDFGPKMNPGEYGAFRAHGFYPAMHGPYAFATGKTPLAAFIAACGNFSGKFCEWPRKQVSVRSGGSDA